jgi:hypothetical protein
MTTNASGLATTTVCRECRKRFPLGRRSNRHRRAGGSPHNGARFCSSGCKQAAYRKRNAEPLKVVQGTNTHRTVTASEISQSLQRAAVGVFTVLGPIVGPVHVLAAEVFGGRTWEHAISSAGIAIQVSRIRPRALVGP